MEKDSQPNVPEKKGKKKQRKKNKKLTEVKENLPGNKGNPEVHSENKPKERPKKEKEKVKQGVLTTNDKSSVFSTNELLNNKEASTLISNLVNCFTSSLSLPTKELENVHAVLCQKTMSVFILILNSCVEKIFNKLVASDDFKNFFVKNKVPKKDAICQTDISCNNS